MFRSDALAGKRILVTGGGSGLGRQMTEKYLSLGADVAICGRRRALLDDVAAALEAAYPGRRVAPYGVDIRDAEAVGAMIDRIWDELGPLDGLVNNAAGNFVSPTKDVSPRGFDAVANIVLHGTFYVTQAVGRRWIAEGRKGSVISIVTTWVWTGAPYVVPSASSKAGVEVMMKSLAVEWGRHGIRLNAIAPGVFPTEGANARLSPKERWTDQTAQNPMDRYGRMEELQNLAAFLMADGVEWLSGQTIAIDGGGYLMNGASFTHLRDKTDQEWAEMRDAIRDRDAQDARDRAVRDDG